ncbi:MAG: hypothetical protein ABIH87_01730 [bacterium]
MFRHKDKKTIKKMDISKIKSVQKDSELEQPIETLEKKQNSISGQGELKELLEKNLKWSQIIYEQNRKINHKLLWAALAGWLRLILVLGPLILAILYLPSVIKEAWSKFDSISGVVDTTTELKGGPLEELIKLFNLSPSQEENTKEALK